MSTTMDTHRLIPLPDAPEGSSVTLGSLAGSAKLLEIDFDHPLRPDLVTNIIEAATDESGMAAVMTASSRISALLRLSSDGGTTDPTLVYSCRNCSLELEAVLPIADVLASRSEPTPALVTIETNSGPIEVQVPTGADLSLWAAAESSPSFADLGLPEGVPIKLAEETLASADPLVDFTLEATCPGCGLHTSIAVDLEALALDGLRAAQSELLAAVHVLAAAYSWDEEAILALSPQRRRRYLELVSSAGERL